MFASSNSYWNMKTNISQHHSASAITLNGFCTGSHCRWTSNSVTNNGTTQTSIGTPTKTTTFSQCSHTPRVSVKVSETLGWHPCYTQTKHAQRKNYEHNYCIIAHTKKMFNLIFYSICS